MKQCCMYSQPKGKLNHSGLGGHAGEYARFLGIAAQRVSKVELRSPKGLCVSAYVPYTLEQWGVGVGRWWGGDTAQGSHCSLC